MKNTINMKKYLKFQLWEFTLTSTSSLRNNVHVSAEAHIIVNDLSFVKKDQVSLTWHVSGIRRCEKAMISDYQEEEIRPPTVQECYSRK